MLIDTHCHVHFRAYKDDMDEVVQRALASGVQMITVGTQKDTSAHGLSFAERYDGVWASIGLHPNHLCEQEFVDENELDPDTVGATIKTRCEQFDMAYYRLLVTHPKCVAIGECGLDYYRLPENVDRAEVLKKQEETVRAHFDLATEAQKPVIIHCRDAHADQIRLIREYVGQGKLARRGVVHCFTGTLEEARGYISLGFKIGIGGILTFPARKGEDAVTPLQRVVQDIPLEHIVVETDAPYLTPLPHRGQRNDPAYVRFVAEKIAALRGISVEEVERVTTHTAKTLFEI